VKRVHYLPLLVFMTLVVVAATLTRRYSDPSTTTAVTAEPDQTAVAQAPLTTTQVITPSATGQTGRVFVQAVAVDADAINPLFATNPTGLAVVDLLFPPLVGQDAATGAANTAGVAEKWRFADSGQTLTLTLYPDLRWSDGAPLTAYDVAFTYGAILEPTLDSPYRDNFVNVAKVTALDERQVEVQLRTPDCTILQTLHQPLLPAHRFLPTAVQVATAPFDTLPLDLSTLRDDALLVQAPISAGPFVLAQWEPGRVLRFTPNPAYRLGAPLLAGWEMRIMGDAAARRQALAAGAVDLVALEPAELSEVAGLNGTQLYTTPLDSLTFVALNLADPATPQPGRDAQGGLVPQAPHPILGTLGVRQALALGIDYAALLQGVYGASAFGLTGYTLPTVAWAYNPELTPYSYAPAAAAQLLTNAGWVDSDGDGIRDRAGVPLRLSLLTNDDSPARVQLGQQLRMQWAQLGIEVLFQATPFETLTRTLLAQRYDMVLIGWDNLGPEPANSDFWHSRQDLPIAADGGAPADNRASGANFVSYQNVAVDQWLDDARTVADCDGGYRAFTYRRIQEQVHEDLPYIILGGQLQGWAYRQGWQGIAPQPWSFTHNVQRWQWAPE